MRHCVAARWRNPVRESVALGVPNALCARARQAASRIAQPVYVESRYGSGLGTGRRFGAGIRRRLEHKPRLAASCELAASVQPQATLQRRARAAFSSRRKNLGRALRRPRSPGHTLPDAQSQVTRWPSPSINSQVNSHRMRTCCAQHQNMRGKSVRLDNPLIHESRRHHVSGHIHCGATHIQDPVHAHN